MKESLIKATSELARVILLSIIPIVMSGITDTGEISINYKVVSAIALLAALRWLDKLLHTYGEAEGNRLLAGGITRF